MVMIFMFQDNNWDNNHHIHNDASDQTAPKVSKRPDRGESIIRRSERDTEDDE